MKKLAKKGNAIIGSVIAFVMGVVGIVIAKDVLNNQTWAAGLETTITTYIVPVALLGLLAMAAYFVKRGRR